MPADPRHSGSEALAPAQIAGQAESTRPVRNRPVIQRPFNKGVRKVKKPLQDTSGMTLNG